MTLKQARKLPVVVASKTWKRAKLLEQFEILCSIAASRDAQLSNLKEIHEAKTKILVEALLAIRNHTVGFINVSLIDDALENYRAEMETKE